MLKEELRRGEERECESEDLGRGELKRGRESVNLRLREGSSKGEKRKNSEDVGVVMRLREKKQDRSERKNAIMRL